MTQIKLVKVEESQKEDFESKIFEGSLYLNNFPKMLTTGIVLFERNDFWYIYLEDKKLISKDHFFIKEELPYMTTLSERESDYELVEKHFG